MTIGYAPPEQLHGRPEPRSDIYALGATIHRVLTHHDAANNKPTIFHFPMLRVLRPDISVAFEQVVARALDGNLEQRWGSAAEMERAVINLPPAEFVVISRAIAHGHWSRAGSSNSQPSQFPLLVTVRLRVRRALYCVRLRSILMPGVSSQLL